MPSRNTPIRPEPSPESDCEYRRTAYAGTSAALGLRETAARPTPMACIANLSRWIHRPSTASDLSPKYRDYRRRVLQLRPRSKEGLTLSHHDRRAATRIVPEPPSRTFRGDLGIAASLTGFVALHSLLFSAGDDVVWLRSIPFRENQKPAPFKAIYSSVACSACLKVSAIWLAMVPARDGRDKCKEM